MAENGTQPMGKVILQVVIIAVVCAVAVVLAQNLIFGKANVAVAGAITGTVTALAAMRLRTSTSVLRNKE
jgi:hypothetical protein